MTPLALAADLEAKHKALVEAQKSNPQQIAMRQLTLEFAFHNHFGTILTALRRVSELEQALQRVSDEQCGSCRALDDFKIAAVLNGEPK